MQKTTTMNNKLIVIQKDTVKLVKTVKDLKIRTANDMVGATNLLSGIVARKKRVEELRKFFVKPLNDQVRKINAEFKTVGEPLANMEANIKKEMVAYRRMEAEKLEAKRLREELRKRKLWEKEQEKLRKQREREAEKERKKIEKEMLNKKAKEAELARIEKEKKIKEEEAQREEFSFDDSDFRQQKSIHSENGSVKVRKHWTFKIVDATKVPKKYFVIDEKLIRADIKAGVRSINGIDIYEEEIIGANV